MIETGVVVALDGTVIHWHLPMGRSSVYLPDTPDLWNVLWENRARLDGFAHTHPGNGFPSPSTTDLTTFVAIELALGRRLRWWIANSEALVDVTMQDLKDPTEYDVRLLSEVPSWLAPLRELSQIKL